MVIDSCIFMNVCMPYESNNIATDVLSNRVFLVERIILQLVEMCVTVSNHYEITYVNFPVVCSVAKSVRYSSPL